MPAPSTRSSTCGAPSSSTEAGPPLKMMACGSRRSMSSHGALHGSISQ